MKIITLKIIDDIVKYTNLHIQSKKDIIQYSRERDARETSRCEIMAVLGLLYLFGTKNASHTNVKELWTTDSTGMEVTKAVMSYKRFLFLLHSIPFDDKNTRQER